MVQLIAILSAMCPCRASEHALSDAVTCVEGMHIFESV